jgi:hypothetical protein
MSIIIHRVGPTTVWGPMYNAHLTHPVVAVPSRNIYNNFCHSNYFIFNFFKKKKSSFYKYIVKINYLEFLNLNRFHTTYEQKTMVGRGLNNPKPPPTCMP